MQHKISALASGFLAILLTISAVNQALAAKCDLTVPKDYVTIQEAIDNALVGDKICVKPGIYTEDLSITKDNLTLKGEGFPTIEGVAVTAAEEFPNAAPNIDIRANGVSITGFTIQSPVVEEGYYSSGIVLTGTNIAIYNNHFFVGTGDISQAIQTWNTSANGPFEAGPDNAEDIDINDISGLHIYNNKFSELAPTTGYDVYEGIYINPQDVAVDGSSAPVMIENNKFSGALIRAITTERTYTVILNNRMSTDATEISETISDYPMGIYLRAGNNISVVKNNVFDNGMAPFQHGIYVRPEVVNSTITKNGAFGAVQYDLYDGSGDCVNNIWLKNRFDSSNPACIE